MIPGDAGALEAAAGELLRGAAGFDGAATRIRGRERDARAVRTGQAALAASDRLDDLARRTTIGAAVSEEVAPVLLRVAAQLRTAQQTYAAAQEQLRTAAASAGPGGLSPAALAAGAAAGAPAQMVTAAETVATADAAAAAQVRAIMAARLGEMQATPPSDIAPPGPPPPPPPGDGSGPHAVRDAEARDHAVKATARAGSAAFEAIGWTNASRHMNHYLGNSGELLHLDPALMLRDDPVFRRRAEAQADLTIRQIADDAVRSRRFDTPIPFDSGWSEHLFDQGTQPDWFYAIGGMSYSTTGTVEVRRPGEPDGTPTVVAEQRLHVFDRYNWDGGKVTEILGQTITDETLQELHRSGLAHEYDAEGSSGLKTTIGPVPETDFSTTQPAPDRPGTRTDLGRDR